jgi:hypothetical protein
MEYRTDSFLGELKPEAAYKHTSSNKIANRLKVIHPLLGERAGVREG